MNANTKNPEMEHCTSPKYGMIFKTDLYNLKDRTKHLKNDQGLKFTSENMALLTNLQYKHCSNL